MQQDSFSTLFTNPNPTEVGYKSAAQDDFTFLNTHCDPPVLAVRTLLEQWFQQYPDGWKKDLARRFRDKRFSQFSGAFWELYLHALFVSLGFEVEVHPTTLLAGTKPDLLLLREGIQFAYVEARLAGLQTDQKVANARLEAELLDALNAVESPNFFLLIRQVRAGINKPSFKELKLKLAQWLASLDPDSPIFAHVARRDEDPAFEWSKDDWYLSLDVTPRSPQSRGKPDIRSVGAHGTTAMWIDTEGEIRAALLDKASRYGELQLPFLIAINYMGPHADHSDWVNALYGSQAVRVFLPDDALHSQIPFRRRNGFWSGGVELRHKQVSAVLAGWYISPFSVAAHSVQLLSHPKPNHALDLQIGLPTWFADVTTGELTLHVGKSAPELLGLSKDWPGPWKPSIDV